MTTRTPLSTPAMMIGLAMLLLQACGDDASSALPDAGTDLIQTADSSPTPDATVQDDCQAAGETQCVGNALSTCEQQPEGKRWSDPVPCDEGTYCRQGECWPPTDKQVQQSASLAAMIDYIADSTGWIEDLSLDLPGLKQQTDEVLFLGDESERSFYTAARRAAVGFPIGHLMITSQTTCGTADFPAQDFSRLGACARPYQDHFVITLALDGNPLGLTAGDRITSVDGLRGQAMIDHVFYQPMCGASSASDDNRHMVAATSLLGVIPPGTLLEITPVDGAPRTEEVGSMTGSMLSCRDPFGRGLKLVSQAELRPDGVGVMRLARFTPLDGFQGQTMDEIMQEIEDLKQEIAAELATIGDAQGLVWDLRGNVGGATHVGLSIVGGMPGAEETFIAHCKSRIPKSDPPAFYPGGNQFDYTVVVDSTFAQPAKVAVIIDGLAISAADYFAYAVSRATQVPLVGSPAAGAYGGGVGAAQVSVDPELIVYSDPTRCSDENDEALEGRSVQPTHPVEYEPSDLAQGVDTLLEHAADLVKP